MLLGDSASSAGVRRIEALTGQAALGYLSNAANQVNALAGVLKAQPGELVARVKALTDERKALQNEVAQLRRELAMSGGSSGTVADEQVGDVTFVGQALTGVSGKDLPVLIDEHKARIKSGVVVLIADTGGKAAVAAGVTDDLKGTISAVDLVRAAVAEVGGKGGGGRPDMAQGGGTQPENAEAALSAVRKLLEG